MIFQHKTAIIEMFQTQLRNITFSLKFSPSFAVILWVRSKLAALLG